MGSRLLKDAKEAEAEARAPAPEPIDPAAAHRRDRIEVRENRVKGALAA